MPSLFENIKKGIRHPVRAFQYVLDRISFTRKQQGWTKDKSGLKKRKYSTYSEYLKHQKSKLDRIEHFLREEYDPKYRAALRNRLKAAGVVKPGMNVLCLAARLGTEVKSFLDMGCFAVGLDLNPGKENKYVVFGDFHNIQFPDNSVDVIFTNSLDHAYNIEKISKEMKRVLKPNGLVVLDIVRGEEEGQSASYYEAASWNKIDDVLSLFAKSNFKIISKSDFEYPWKGEHISMQLKK